MRQGAVLIGSGPSLNIAELRQLGGFPAIAFNRSFIAWDDWGFTPAYYACTNAATAELVIHDAESILAFDGLTRIWLHPLFRENAAVRGDRRVIFMEPAGSGFGCRDGIMGDYGNVGASSLQLLWSAGHTRVLLMGTDARYSARTGGPAINHFHPDYIPHGFSSTVPPRTEGWKDAVSDALDCGMELRLRADGSALAGIAGLAEDRASLDEAKAWLAGRTGTDRQAAAGGDGKAGA